jgi:hypothetical protein
MGRETKRVSRPTRRIHNETTRQHSSVPGAWLGKGEDAPRRASVLDGRVSDGILPGSRVRRGLRLGDDALRPRDGGFGEPASK